ncbi:MAG: tagaturonate epimerase family protein [Acidobacteriota bacterium]
MSLVQRLADMTADCQLTDQDTGDLCQKLRQVGNFQVYPKSIAAGKKALFLMISRPGAKSLGILSVDDVPKGFQGPVHRVVIEGVMTNLAICPLTPDNAVALSRLFGFLVPKPLGLAKSFGCGDRLGLATPGHIRALRRLSGNNGRAGISLVLAQQSMRENARTGRTPQSVLSDACWGIFQEGWRGGFGADADHLKTPADIDTCVAAGYTFFTVDPGDHVDETADSLPAGELRQRADALPWTFLETRQADLVRNLTSKDFDFGNFRLKLTEEQVLRAAVKYGRVVAHTIKMFRHLAERMGDRAFDLEMSVDETNSVTSLPEHVYIGTEMKRLGARWVSLAPRYVGRFEKGVDYMGRPGMELEAALQEFEKDFARHVAVARALGPYKLSLHSGSDKFAIYPVYSRLAGDLVHVKTAGTSYLEALRAISRINPALFRDILCFALERYAVDRATYHVSAEMNKVPDIGGLPNEELSSLLDNFHARQALHVTFGSVLHDERFRTELYSALRSNEEVYYGVLEEHFVRHMSPFCGAVPKGENRI